MVDEYEARYRIRNKFESKQPKNGRVAVGKVGQVDLKDLVNGLSRKLG